MKAGQIVTAVFGVVLKIAAVVLVLMFIYKGISVTYDYGYRVFKEEPVSEKPGVDVDVQVTLGKNALQIGELLEQKGLIRDAKLFYIQNLFSAYKDELKPGEYTLNTSMTMNEMMAVMAAGKPEQVDVFIPDDGTGGGAGDTENDNE